MHSFLTANTQATIRVPKTFLTKLTRSQ